MPPRLHTVIDEWASSTSKRPRAGACETCDAEPRFQRLFNSLSQRPTWRCTRCHATTDVVLPWEPNVAPEGHREGLLAIDTLAIYAPILAPIDREALYRILRPYFTGGWTVRDVLHGMDYRPDGQLHWETGISWVRNEPHDRTLARLLFRLRTWRWGEADHADGQDIMAGGHTAMVTAMRTRAEAQLADQAARRAEWDRQAEYARTAEDRGAPAGARRAAEVAAILGRQRRMAGDAREAELRAQRVAEARSPFGPPPEPDASPDG